MIGEKKELVFRSTQTDDVSAMQDDLNIFKQYLLMSNGALY